MDVQKVIELLQNVQNGALSVDEALSTLKTLPYDNLEFARLDSHRVLRTGYPEVIYCKGKTLEQIVLIVASMVKRHSTVIGSKADTTVYSALNDLYSQCEYNEVAQMILIGEPLPMITDKKILIMTAGTSDIPIAEEAAISAEFFGNKVERLFDVGVAGIHRLFDNINYIEEASVIIVIAGMDGALPSIVGGITDKPVIAVPTSVGYGASFEGLSALLTMLNSCSPGVVVVNIDNGFGAGHFASLINKG